MSELLESFVSKMSRPKRIVKVLKDTAVAVAKTESVTETTSTVVVETAVKVKTVGRGAAKTASTKKRQPSEYIEPNVTTGLRVSEDGLKRCWNSKDEDMKAYHDVMWGSPGQHKTTQQLFHQVSFASFSRDVPCPRLTSPLIR